MATRESIAACLVDQLGEKKQGTCLIKTFSFSSPRTQHAHWKKKFLLNPRYWSFVDKSF